MGGLESLFIVLTRALEGAPLAALSAAAAWGVLSILLSPCHLASLPLVVGFMNGQGALTTRRAFAISALFATGILLSIAGIGVLTAAFGRMLGDIGPWGSRAVAIIFLLVGLHLLGLLGAPWSGPGTMTSSRKGPLAAFILGLVFGVALGPCTFAFMAPILGITFGLAAESRISGLSLLLAYALGHCAVIVFAGTFTEVVQRYLDWNEASRGSILLRKICGVLVVVSGGWLVYAGP